MEENTDTTSTNDVNENCTDLYKLKETQTNNESNENENITYRSVINVNLLNNNTTNVIIPTNTSLKSDLLNGTTLNSPNLVKNNNLKNIENIIVTSKNIFDEHKLDDESANVITPTKTIVVHSETLTKPLKSILKNSTLNTPSQSPVKNIFQDNSKIVIDGVTTSTSQSPVKKITANNKSSVDEIHSRLVESQCKISQLQNSLPTKLNSATIDAIKSNYSPIKNYLRTTHSPFKTKLALNKKTDQHESKENAENNSINSVSFNVDTVKTHDTTYEQTNDENEFEKESIESLEDEFPEKLDAYARFIKEYTMSEDNNKKKKRSNSFRKIFPAKLFGLQKDKTKCEPKTTDGKASTSSDRSTPLSTGYFNRNTRERHTFTNFSCKNYSKECRNFEVRHEDYPLSAWDGCENSSYFKEDEYSLPIDACIRRNDKIYTNQKDDSSNKTITNNVNHTRTRTRTRTTCSGEDYVCMNSNNLQTVSPSMKNDTITTASYVNIDNDLIKENSTSYFYEKTDENTSIRKTNNSGVSSVCNIPIDITQDRHVLIEPTKAVIPLNTERALPNPYHKNNNNNVLTENIILEPMYINVNNKKQEQFDKQNWNDDSSCTLEQNFDKEKNLVDQQNEKEKNLQKIINLQMNYETKITNSPYETIFGNVRHHGRISTRSLSPEQRYKMDVKTPCSSIKNRNNIDDTNTRTNCTSASSSVHKSFNNDCCLKSSPKKERDNTLKESSSKSPIAKLKSNKNDSKKKKNVQTETDGESSHQNLEIPIDYPEVNLNNASKISPKKQLYENFPPYSESHKNTEIFQNEIKTNQNNICNSRSESSNRTANQSDQLVEINVNSAHYHDSPTNMKSSEFVNNTSENRFQQQPSHIVDTLAPSQDHLANSSSINTSPLPLQNLHINEQQFESITKDMYKNIPNNNNNNSRLSQPSPLRISPAIISHSSNSSPVNYSRMSLENNSGQSSVSPQNLCNNSSIINYNNTTRMMQTPPIHQIGRGVSPTSPQKLRNLQNVEAFYWKKISEMKEREQMNHMYFNPQSQHSPQITTPQMNQPQYRNNIDTRQSRSRDISSHPPIPQNRGRRSLSLPRNIKPERPNNNMYTNQIQSFEEPIRFYPNQLQCSEGNTSGHGYTTIVQQALPTNQLPPINPNFNRRTPQRSTISAINCNTKSKTSQFGDAIYENYVPGVQFRHQAQAVNKSSDQTYAPIFKRGSLQQQSQEDINIGGSSQKKVSFLSATQSVVEANQQNSPAAWPTKNGYVQSPPTRRNNRSESVGSDNVFITGTPTNVTSNCDRSQMFFPNNQELLSPIYGRTAQNQQIISAPMYGQDIYGQAIYGKTVQMPQDMYNETTQNNQNVIYGRTSSTLYGKTIQPKQVIVRNKICDMYGRIHDTPDECNKNQIYGQIKKSGIIYGELKAPGNNSSSTSNNNVNLQTMNRLQQRALPSPPQQQQSSSMVVPRSSTYAYNLNNSNTQMNQLSSSSQQIPSESESGSEAGEVQRIMQNSQHMKNQPIPGI